VAVFYGKVKKLFMDKLIVVQTFITGKLNRAIRNYLIGAIVTYILIRLDFITNYIFGFSDKIGYLYLGILIFLHLILFTALGVVFMKFINDKLNEKTYKENEKYKKKLFIWLGEDYVSERFLYNLFSSDANEDFDDIDNLKSVKEKLEIELGGEITNYHLLKNHLEFKQRNNSMKKLKVIMFTLLGTLITALISPLIQKAINIGQYIDNQDFGLLFKNFASMDNYSLFLYLGVGFSVYFMILGTFSSLTVNSRRNEYLISILGILIEEKKTNQ